MIRMAQFLFFHPWFYLACERNATAFLQTAD
jgi:hypothetical protein